MREIKGISDREDLQIGVVVSSFNEFITRRLLDGALEALRANRVKEDLITTVWVPGSFEIPQVASILADSGEYQAIVCLGAVIKGETAHFDYISAETARGISSLALESDIPVIFGVLTVYDTQQAIDRAGGKLGNKGYDAALAALEMISILEQLEMPLLESSD